MALNTDISFGSFSLPALSEVAQMDPTGRPYTPSMSMTQPKPSTRNSPSRIILHDDESLVSQLRRRASKTLNNRDDAALRDPRRFTPTLHASLVSEILSLRREVENKNGQLTGLEETLQTAQEQNVKLDEVISENAKETRSLRRQMQMLEGGTLSALEDLAKERDTAHANLAEAHRRWDTTTKKLRSHEEETDKIHMLWEQERVNWDAEKRKLDRKIHVVEGRLKTVLVELDQTTVRPGSSHRPGSSQTLHQIDGSRDSASRTGFQPQRRSTSAMNHQRKDSQLSTDSIDPEPMSRQYSRASDIKGSIFNGQSLAEELAFEADDSNDESDSNALYEELMPQPRPFSVQSQDQSTKARKRLGLSIEVDEKTIDGESQRSTSPYPASRISYADTGTQFSPSPTSAINEVPANGADHSAGDTRQRASSHTEQTSRTIVMVSQASQTVEQPPSPSETSIESLRHQLTLIERQRDPIEMIMASTQTEADVPSSLPFLPSSDAIAGPATTDEPVPIIAIHPPNTGRNSPDLGVVLPPRTRNAACQVSIMAPTRSSSAQTEGIRVDQRAFKLPPHLLPSAVTSRPSSPSVGRSTARNSAGRDSVGSLLGKESARNSVIKDSVRHSIGKDSVRSSVIRDSPRYLVGKDWARYPAGKEAQKHSVALPRNGASSSQWDSRVIEVDSEDNDDISLRNFTTIQPRHEEDLFVGFDSSNDAVLHDLEAVHLDDRDFTNGSTVRKTLSKVQNAWKLVPQTADALTDRLASHARPLSTVDSLAGSKSASEDVRSYATGTTSPDHKAPRYNGRSSSSSKAGDIRRAALISSGAASHAHRVRSPSAPSLPDSESNPLGPPFPVPTRSSSRKPPKFSASDGTRSPTPWSFRSSRDSREFIPPKLRRPVRKVRSAAANIEVIRSRSCSPDLDSPELPPPPPPPLPQDDVVSSQQATFQHVRSATRARAPSSSSAAGTSAEPTSVVDAIAQTMIGEWMWKYVRRRKSFGLPETGALETEAKGGHDGGGAGVGNGIRHRRWVWLAPYERAVMWSGKQPTSGSALMGKSGRKLAIQSVLDVKDDTMMPKNAAPESSFGRSILILTPQRALKFTATSRERHFIWLNALSFLSQSSFDADPLSRLPDAMLHPHESSMPPRGPSAPLPPPLPSSAYPVASSTAPPSLRRNGIRDSIRLAKGKARLPTPPLHSRRDSLDHLDDADAANELLAAEPPLVPRYTSSRARTQSSTGPRQAPSVRSFTSSQKASMRSLRSSHATAPNEGSSRPVWNLFGGGTSGGTSGVGSGEITAMSASSFPHGRGDTRRRGDVVSGELFPPGDVLPSDGPFDSIGTMRMAAFVDTTTPRMDARHQRSAVVNQLDRRDAQRCDPPTMARSTGSSSSRPPQQEHPHLKRRNESRPSQNLHNNRHHQNIINHNSNSYDTKYLASAPPRRSSISSVGEHPDGGTFAPPPSFGRREVVVSDGEVGKTRRGVRRFRDGDGIKERGARFWRRGATAHGTTAGDVFERF